MSEILKSLHGRQVGLNSNGRLIVPGGFISGAHGSQFSASSPSRIVDLDDFTGDLFDARWNTLEGTDSATSDAAILAGGIGGVLRLTTGDAGTGLAADMVQVTQALQWRVSNGGLHFQARLKLSAITTCYVFVGLTDLSTTLEAPIESAVSANTLTSTATDAVGFMFDTRMTDDTWWLVGVKTDTDATHQNTGFAPVADTYAEFRIEVTATGAATFFYNGVMVGTAMSNALATAPALTPTINASKTSVAASMTVDVDYVLIEMNR